MNIRWTILITYGAIISGVVTVAVLSLMLRNANDQLEESRQRRHESILLADELRQSSDDLTRFARTYVSTGDARYEKMYWDVLDIRNGKKLRPEHYDRVYWDLVQVGSSTMPRLDSSEAVPLKELMKRTGVTEAEFAKLTDSQKNSDDLVAVERIAMNMVKGVYDDGNGNFTVKRAPDLETARKLMHDENYHKFKVSIMKPVEEFQEMLDERTKLETSLLFRKTTSLFAALQAILLALFLTTILLFKLKKHYQDLEAQVAKSTIELSAAQALAKKEAERIAQSAKYTEEREQAYSELKNAQMQLFQQEKMASIGQLAAGVAHEINNPMGFITSNLGTLEKYMSKINEYLGIVESGKDSAAARSRLKIDYVLKDSGQLITESLDGATRVKNIVNDLKNLSRTDKAEPVWVDLNSCLQSSLNIACNEIKYVANIEKQFGVIPEILCHPQQLSQVFINLLANAGQAIEGHGSITIRTWCEDDYVFVSVADTGKGIPEEIRKNIFDPFFTTKDVGKGTGLGLSISYDIIQKHGGEITVKSEVGMGTTFVVCLPVEHSGWQ